MTAKRDRFEQVLKNSFSIENFVAFTKELLTDEEIVAPYKYNEVRNNFSFYIAGYTHIANYTGKDRKKIAVFAIQLNKGEAVDRARSMQRNFAKRLIEDGGCDGALVAFYTTGEPKWRLSFVRMDYEFAKGKVITKLTPAKRYSYLVGEGEPCHTAMSRLFPIFENDETNPSIDELEEAFSVEKVTEEFFSQYCEKYHQVREWLEKSQDFMDAANYHNFTSEQYAKKLMGQIVFLYFVQKKGWLGVNSFPVSLTEREYKNALFLKGSKSKELVSAVLYKFKDNEYRFNTEAVSALSNNDEEFLASCIKGQAWGTGPKDFMRRLYTICEKYNKNYFTDYLEPLFYTGLNVNRGENGYFPALHCRIPFLNGGLFEQLDNYDWENRNFDLPNALFSNINDKGREADGILDIFDRYNFTMNEDEPMEKEVAIDPEMLGKIFENLLDVKDRKSKGAFYTPREIVHYMCQESIANYLVAETGLPYNDIKDFILYGEIMKDEDTKKEVREGNGEMFISSTIFDLKSGINRFHDIDIALANIRIADPAVGSGAFPLGMLNEIVRARMNISAYLGISMTAQAKRLMYAFDRHPYMLKTHTIKNCIFAVDIEPSAVDIAKLRLWLSLVIDDEINPTAQNELEGHPKPRALPNLDCNIICGNSLIDEFEGIRLINKSELFGIHNTEKQLYIGQSQYEGLLNQLFEAQEMLFRESSHEVKVELKARIQDLMDTIVLFNLKNTTSPETIEKYHNVKSSASLPFFLWELEFGRVFKEKGGFDVVIGNPPYVQISKGIFNSDRFPYSEGKDKGKQNLYKLFIENAYNLCKRNGITCLIVQSSIMCDLSSTNTRELLLKNTTIIQFVEFPKKVAKDETQVFASVLQGTCICNFQKRMPSDQHELLISVGNSIGSIRKLIFEPIVQKSIFYLYPESLYFPLIKPGDFSIIEKILKKSINFASKIDSISQGDLNLTTSKDFFSTNIISKTVLLRGRHIGRYHVNYEAEEYVSDCFLKEKVRDNTKNVYIVGQEITGTTDKWRLHFAITDNTKNFLFGHTANKILLYDSSLNYFILGLLNSKYMDWLYRKTSTNNHVMGYEIRQLPVLIADDKTIMAISEIVQNVLAKKNDLQSYDSHVEEKCINELIYCFLGLDIAEIEVIEQGI